MARSRRVGGTGWAGVHGSFIGIGKAKPTGGGGVSLKKSKAKAKVVKIDLAALPDNEDVQKAAKRVMAVQTDIQRANERLSALTSQLAQLMEKFDLALAAVNGPGKAAEPAKPHVKALKK